MSVKPRSLRQAQSLLAGHLRAQGRTWAEIAAEFRAAYRVNARVALRQAHGWSQPQAATRWTARWPDDPKTFKNFSYWELWPSGTGHAPSLDTLDRLAQLYECKITDLLADCDDYGARSATAPLATARRSPGDRSPGDRSPGDRSPGDHSPGDRSPGNHSPGNHSPGNRGRRAGSAIGRGHELAWSASDGIDPGSAEPFRALHAALAKIREAQSGELTSSSAEGAETGLRLRRRTLLLEASSALAVVAAAPLLEVPHRVGTMSGRPLRTDPAIVDYSAEVVAGLRRLGGTVGPRITLPPAMALRSAMAAMARNAPETVTAQALAVYGDLTQLVGWLMFNLGDRGAARYYYEDARSVAYQADNADLVTYALAASSQLATAQGNGRDAIDHARAAQQAARSGTPFAVAYAADITARAYAAAGQLARCQAALDREQAALSAIGPQTARAPWWYFYDRSFYWGTESECALRLGMAVDACDAAGRSLGTGTAVNLHNSALTLAFRAEALIRQSEVDAACQALAEAARLTTLNSSQRILRRIDGLRAELVVCDNTAAVRELDEKLAAYRQARTAGEPA